MQPFIWHTSLAYDSRTTQLTLLAIWPLLHSDITHLLHFATLHEVDNHIFTPRCTWHILPLYKSANTSVTHPANITPCYHTHCNNFSVLPPCFDQTSNTIRFSDYAIIGTLLFPVYWWPLFLIQTRHEQNVIENLYN